VGAGKKKTKKASPASKSIPRCEALVYKEAGKDGIQCAHPATVVVNMTTPQGEYTGSVAFCSTHLTWFSTGHAMITRDIDGVLNYVVPPDYNGNVGTTPPPVKP
jgi:hypothetical protein